MPELPRSYKKGELVEGKVERIFPYGVFLRLEDGTQAYIRRRELSLTGDEDPQKVTTVGSTLKGRVLDPEQFDRSLELSHRAALPDPWPEFLRDHSQGGIVTATVRELWPEGVYVEPVPGVRGWIPLAELSTSRVARPEDVVWRGDLIEAVITHIDPVRRRLTLSIRQRMRSLARAEELTKVFYQPPPPSERPTAARTAQDKSERPEDRPLTGLKGGVMIVEDNDAIRSALARLLEVRGARVEAFASGDAALRRGDHDDFAVAFVDLEMPGLDGLGFMRRLRQDRRTVILAVISHPQLLQARWPALAEVGVTGVFAKPLNTEEILGFLARISGGETPAPLSAPDGAAEPRSEEAAAAPAREALEQRLSRWLEQARRDTGAHQAILFGRDAATHRIESVAGAGDLPTHDRHVYELSGSPVNDVLEERRTIVDNHASRDVHFRLVNLQKFIAFESCCGVPIEVGGVVGHALFLFSRAAGAFSDDAVRRAETWATWLSIGLEADQLQGHLRSLSGVLLSGQMAAGFGHEVFNRLTAMQVQFGKLHDDFERLADRHPAPESATEFNAVGAGVDQAVQTAEDLGEIALHFREVLEKSSPRSVDVNLLLRQTAEQIGPLARRAGIEVRFRLAPKMAEVNAERAALYQVCLNLMLNAVQHMEDPARPVRALTLSTQMGPPGDPLPVQVRCEDTGPGIHGSLRERVFEPGYTTRPGGTGLGLFIARDLVGRMGGEISVEQSIIGIGSTFLIRLPVAGGG